MTMVVYLDPNRVTDERQGEPPRNPYRGGYGPKIPSSWELQIDGKRWHRVYVMQWSNSGTPYVLVKGKQLLLGSYEPGGAARARARELASRRDPARRGRPLSESKRRLAFSVLNNSFGSPSHQQRGFSSEEAAARSAATLLAAQAKIAYPTAILLVKEWYSK